MRKSKTQATWRVALLISLSCAFVAAVHGQAAPPAQHGPDQSCLEAAHKALGPDAEVLKCGHLTNSGALEAVAATRLKQFRTTADGVPVSKLLVLQQQESRWVAQLTADKHWVRNGIGYLADAAVDPSELARFLATYSAHFVGYRVSFSDHSSDGAPDFTVWVYILSSTGKNEGTAYEVNWNPVVARFQDFDYGRNPEGFRSEIKYPSHIRTRKP